MTGSSNSSSAQQGWVFLLKRFVEGQDRSQNTRFPESLEDHIAKDHTVRVIEAFAEGLDF